MLLNKKVFYFSLVISFCTLLLSIIFNFIYVNDITIFISNILLNIFAGTIVLIATSLFDYFIQKRKNLKLLMDKILSFRNLFNNINYLEDINNFPNFDEYQSYYKKKGKEYTPKMYETAKSNHLKRIKNKMDKIIDQYIRISEVSFNEMWQLYDEIYFLNPFSQKRKWLYEKIFNYLYQLKIKIETETYHFKIYKNSTSGNFEVNYEKILKLQKEIFYFERLYGDDYNWKHNYNDKDLLAWGTNVISNSHYIVYNDVAIKLTHLFIEVGKINYSKKYRG